MLAWDEKTATTLAFVSLQEKGERDFVFHRGADAFMTMDDIDLNEINKAKIFHFGSATAMLTSPFREAYLSIISSAREKGKFISFDPNYRRDLWKERLVDFISIAKKAISLSDFVKVSEEVLEIITGTKNHELGVDILHHIGARIVAVTLGKRGTLISNSSKKKLVKSIPVMSIDSTGAGDAFVGATLFKLSNIHDIKFIEKDFEQLLDIITFANRIGALVCTKIGAIEALPSIEEIEGSTI
jgi:fructokinase